MSSFDDLTDEQQKAVTELADKVIAKNKLIEKHNEKVIADTKEEFKSFLNRKGELSKDIVPVEDLDYDHEQIHRMHDNSGPHIKRVLVTFNNRYELSVMLTPDVYGANKSVFAVAAYTPDNEMDTSLLSPLLNKSAPVNNQTVKNISEHMATVAAIKPKSEESKELNDKSDK